MVGERQFSWVLLTGLLGLLLFACDGQIGGSGFDGPGSPFRGDDPAVVGSPSESTLLRLSKQQHQKTLANLLENFLDNEAPAVLQALDPVYSIIPDDPADLNIPGLVGSSYSRMSQTVGELHVRGYFEVARTVADAVAFDSSRRTALFGDCIDAAGDDHSSCVDSFLDTFGLWVMRRPLTLEERTFLLDTVFADDGSNYAASPESLHDLLVALLVSPNFLYFVNTNGEEIGEGRFELDPYELASRLSYHFWDSMPDQALFDAAADGRLMTDNGYADQVARLYADPRTDETFEKFIFEWLALYKTGDPFGGVTSDDIRKMTFIEGYDVAPALRENMVQEVLDMAEYYRQSGTFLDLFTSNESFAKTSDLAAIYGAPVWDGDGIPEPLPNPERLGILGRAALLSSATVATHPILRGVRIREDLMCDVLGEPPDNVNTTQQDLESVATTRQRIDNLTSPGSCAGCHTFINGLGFPLEAFDSLGRFRADEMFIDIEGNVTMLPLDLESTPFINGTQDTTTVLGPAELVETVIASGKLEECFARHYVRFTLGLLADPAFGGDPGTIGAIARLTQSGAPLADVFKEIAYLPAFKQRRKGADN